MPLVGPTSYVATTEEFLTHWLAANASLGPGNEIILQGDVTQAALQALLDALVSKRSELNGKLVFEQLARGDIEVKKEALLLRINQFNETIRADFAGSKWEKTLPNVPSLGDGQGVFVAPLDDAGTLWLQLNAALAPAAPVTLLGGYTQAAFTADVAALNAAYTSWRSAGLLAKLTLQERNELQEQIQPILVSYRKKLPTKFPKGHAFVESLPDLSPAPGSTPAAVPASAVWDMAQQRAKITWDASSATDLDHYEIRFCAGPNYDTNLESVLARIEPAAPREFLTATGLAEPGNVASFKVYVITSTGNEKGSNPVNVTHPAA